MSSKWKQFLVSIGKEENEADVSAAAMMANPDGSVFARGRSDQCKLDPGMAREMERYFDISPRSVRLTEFTVDDIPQIEGMFPGKLLDVSAFAPTRISPEAIVLDAEFGAEETEYRTFVRLPWWPELAALPTAEERFGTWLKNLINGIVEESPALPLLDKTTLAPGLVGDEMPPQVRRAVFALLLEDPFECK